MNSRSLSGASSSPLPILPEWSRPPDALPLYGNGLSDDIPLPASSLVLERRGYSDREALYNDFQPLVRRMIRQYGGEDPERRKDLVGEIYCRFCAILAAYDPNLGVPLRPYLVRQLTASVFTYVRQYWRSEKREVRLDMAKSGWEPSTVTDPTAEWHDRMVQADMLRSLPQAIARLPRRQRQVVIWRYYEQKSFAEIAGMLDVQPSTARSILRHALRGLRQWAAETYLT